MGILNDCVIAGDYKNGNFKIKGFKQEKVVLEYRTMLGKSEIKLDKKTVESIAIKKQENNMFTSFYQVEIIFNNGKKCLAILNSITYDKLSAAIY